VIVVVSTTVKTITVVVIVFKAVCGDTCVIVEVGAVAVTVADFIPIQSQADAIADGLKRGLPFFERHTRLEGITLAARAFKSRLATTSMIVVVVVEYAVMVIRDCWVETSVCCQTSTFVVTTG
jgi:hypothetical protein